jgi:eukaryotic-like serine/threonine-protein kinase
MADTHARLTAALTGRYAIERELGAGGMATVYLAQDLRHNRPVAIKVLRPELAAVIGGERFLSEITTTANLQHPHILPLFDSGQVDGTVFYVMPFVEGESLRDRLTREKQLPIADAVRIATEVASALDYAHRHGVIHRDIKPENILLHDGRALVADFGIALAVSRSEGGSRMTETGMSLGTPHYMSPEQAMGERALDARTDVYALGCVLYEMLTGDPPFLGSSAQAVVAKVMTEKPAPIRGFRDTVPEQVEAAVLVALAKLPADRFASAAEFAAALTAKPGASTTVRLPAYRAGSRAGSRALLAAVAVAAVATAVWFAIAAHRRPPQPVSRFTVDVPEFRSNALNFNGNAFALSPDGARFAYVGSLPSGGTRLWVRDRDDLKPRTLDGTEGADGPFFSPDGRWIGYFADGRLFKVAVRGGAPIALADSAQVSPPGGAWLPDDRIVFVTPSFALLAVPAGGGTPELLVPADPRRAFVFPTALPRSDAVLLTECTNNCARMTVLALDLKSRAIDTLLQNTARAWYLPTGHLVSVRQDGSVVGVLFDPKSLKIKGAPVPFLTGVQLDLGVTPEFTVAADGTLLYQPTDPSGGIVTAVRVDRQGTPVVLDPAWRANMTYPGLSPDGRRLAVSIQSGARTDLWVKQLDAGPLTRLTFDGALNYRPTWRPDGRSLDFTSDPDGLSHLYNVRADGSGKPERILPGDSMQIDESLWSSDGRWLIYRSGVSDGQRDIWARRLDGDTARVTVAAGSFDEYEPALSPDGRWVAYVSVESGQEEVYVRPFPGTDQARWQLSTLGGSQPLWSRSGRELFYVTPGDSLVAVEIAPGAEFHPGARKALFSTRKMVLQPLHQSYAVTPDDRGFIMFQAAGAGESRTTLTVVLNWFDEVRARMGGKGG